ncbi:glycerophosphoryl diester phosphodiesterase [Granulicella aggregans]|uniref:Glycerophosphoryl diester phosphodiesterase n=1 Tax=Granulicella aggregans TaxID=474949 RepID=A0A7W8E5J0_9BACT|nr:glycerophosphodiester phosphodiesterase family protein [Granulicella aggregans]MBB5059686.1 glycerophosphoryl diester phosphodiesterase [Granulicella aggregans]
MRHKPIFFASLALLFAASPLYAGIFQRGKVQLICHRTANEDMPENTLESLALAARMGCNVIEVDVRRTLDGVLVLNHDGYLERLTDGMGDVETTTFQELHLLDYGGWMSSRFSPMRFPTFDDALRVAREQRVDLALDLKEKGLTTQIFAALQKEGMLEHVNFGGDDGNADELNALYPAASADAVAWLGPQANKDEVEKLHALGKFVVANFSASLNEMDLPAMRAAVAAGVDTINVDYPRLGADAVGRPVEAKIAALAKATQQGSIEQRAAAIYELSLYSGFPTQAVFQTSLMDSNPRISHAAALALRTSRPAAPASVFTEALSAATVAPRQSAVWALGMMHAPITSTLIEQLHSTDAGLLKETLLAISRSPGDVPAELLLPFLERPEPAIRGAASLALAVHQPTLAATALPALLYREEQHSAEAQARRGKHKLTQAEIDPIVEEYREHMKLIHALELLSPSSGLPLLTREAFRSADDPSHVTAPLAGFGLWDRIAGDPSAVIAALSSPSREAADRAEWILVKADPSVLPALRTALTSASPALRIRLIQILAWQGDQAATPVLHALKTSDTSDVQLIDWALRTIALLHFPKENNFASAE